MKNVKREPPSWFTRAAKAASRAAGRPATFAIAVAVIMLWALTGPIFDYSDTWQLIINTSTTIITFLIVFLIQNTQNRDTAALQIKLDELLRSMENAHTVLLDLEELDDEELRLIREEYLELARKAMEDLKRGRVDTGVPRL
jgi:low affinity Fe/Cu permease